MKKLKRTQLLPMARTLAGLGALGLSSLPAYADFYIHSWDDHHTALQRWDLDGELMYFHSSSNYDSTGSSFTPSGFDSYQRYVLDLNATYGITPKLSAYARMDWAVAKSGTYNTNAFAGTVYGLGDQTLGLNYRVFENPSGLGVDLQAQLDFPGYSNNSQGATSVTDGTLGDGSTDFTAGGFVSLPITDTEDSQIRVVGGAGYTYRTKSFSAAAPWSVFAELKPRHDGIVVSGGVFGMASLHNDSRPGSATLVDTSTGSLGSGGSYYTNAINPSLVSARGQAGYRSGNVIFLGTIAQTVWGKEAPNGTTFGLAIQASLGGATKSREARDPIFQGTDKYGRSNKGYVNYDIEAKVLRSNDRFQLVKIDKGIDDGVQVGDTFDIFMTKSDGSQGAAIARGRVASAKGKEAAIKIEEYFKEVWIDEGFIARRPIP